MMNFTKRDAALSLTVESLLLGLLARLDLGAAIYGGLEYLDGHAVEVLNLLLDVALHALLNLLLLLLVLGLLARGFLVGEFVNLLLLGGHSLDEVVGSEDGLVAILGSLAEEERLDGLLYLTTGESLDGIGGAEQVVGSERRGERETRRDEPLDNIRTSLAAGEVELRSCFEMIR